MYQPNLNKIILVGHNQSGKNHLFHYFFNQLSLSSTRFGDTTQFKAMELATENGILPIQLWEIASNELNFDAHQPGTNLVLITISTHLSNQGKIYEINHWIQTIVKNNRGFDKIPVAIIEMNSKEGNTQFLSTTDLNQFGENYVFHQVFSYNNTEESITQLKSKIVTYSNMLRGPLRPAMEIPPSISFKKAEFLSKILKLDPIKRHHLLSSLLRLLYCGPINQPSNHYDLRFGGGIPLTLHGRIYDFKVPINVYNWMQKIDMYINPQHEQNHVGLLEIHGALVDISIDKPFLRCQSTHDFYKNCLLGFINFALTQPLELNMMNYFNVRDQIVDLDVVSVKNILEWLTGKLLKGPRNNIRSPYSVGLFGGKKFTTLDKSKPITIRTDVPYAELSTTLNPYDTFTITTHAAALLNIIVDPSKINLEQIPAEKLIVALDYTIAMGYSLSSDRDESTKRFYEGLSSELINKIVETHAHKSQLNHGMTR